MSTQTNESGTTLANAAPAHELALVEPLSATVQQVLDEAGNTSALYLGRDNVGIGTANPSAPLVVEGETPHGKSLQLIRSTGKEASLEFITSGGLAWRIGVAGNDGKHFFLWNGTPHLVLVVDGSHFHFQGPISAPTVNATTLTADTLLVPKLERYTQAPAGADLQSVVVDKSTGKLYYL